MNATLFANPDLGVLADDLRFLNALDERGQAGKQIYFDTSGVIDMLRGLESLFFGGRIREDLFNRESTLVYALAYKNWLGPIYTLPPHTEEFIHVLNSDKLPDHFPADAELLRNEFRYRIQDATALPSNAAGTNGSKLPESLAEKATVYFKHAYLESHNGFWKRRYKYLVKDKGILNFLQEADYRIGDVTQRPLFTQILKFLNTQRDKRSNNYIDAVALCLLDEKLRKAEQNGGPIPVFFSDQTRMLDAASHFSQFEFDGRKPFLFESGDKKFLVVRTASFFLLEGIANALRSDRSLDEMLSAIDAIKHTNGNTLSQWSKLEISLQNGTYKKIALEFFSRWWSEGGREELQQVLEEGSDLDDAQVDAYILEERMRLHEHFLHYSDRIQIIRKTWDAFQSTAQQIQKQFQGEGERYDAYQELGARYSYPETICQRVQDWIDHAILLRGQEEKSADVELIKADIVNYLVIGLFEKSRTESERANQLNQLAIGLAILWIFQKYDLIDRVCTIVRRQTEASGDTENKYPNPSIALLHAAACILGQEKKVDEAREIIRCVETKPNNNYKLWVSLSYLFYRLWLHRVENPDFPEIRPEHALEQIPPEVTELLNTAAGFSRRAIDWLELEFQKPEQPQAKSNYRRRKYNYALNNYVFFLTILTPAETFFETVAPWADKFKDRMANPEHWHQARFADTLSRYYFRLAVLADADHRDHAPLYDWTRQFNQTSLDTCAHAERQLYQALQVKLSDWKIKRDMRQPRSAKMEDVSI